MHGQLGSARAELLPQIEDGLTESLLILVHCPVRCPALLELAHRNIILGSTQSVSTSKRHLCKYTSLLQSLLGELGGTLWVLIGAVQHAAASCAASLYTQCRYKLYGWTAPRQRANHDGQENLHTP